MKNLHITLFIALFIGQNLCASESRTMQEYKILQEYILREYISCTERVMDQPRFLGIDVRSALYNCKRQYEKDKNQLMIDQHNEMRSAIEEYNKELSERMKTKN